MINDERMALFLMLGQTASRMLGETPETAHSEPLLLSDSFDLSTTVPESVKAAAEASVGYRLFFVFENYLREFVVEALSGDGEETWWEKIPTNVRDEIERIEDTEEAKRWMALGSRDKSALMTYPQLLAVIDHNWKDCFRDLIRDKALIQEARLVSHLRNTVCHMSPISDEELDRLRQVMRDWFRMVSP